MVCATLASKSYDKNPKGARNGMELHELEYFVAIAREGNITRAAEKLYVSQPTLTKYLQRVEKEAGPPLFQRAGRRLVPTYAGERYLARAEELLRIGRELDAELADLRQEDSGRLRVGIPPVRCSYSLPAVLPGFRRLHPNVEIRILEEDSERLDAALCAGETDLNFYNLSAQDPRLEYQLLSRDAVCAVLPAGHPAGKSAVQRGDSRELDLSSLTGETFLLQKRTQRQGQYLYELMRRQKVTPARVLETSNIRAAFALAVNGYGVAFLAEGLLRRLDQGQPFDAYRLTGGPSMDFVAAWRKGSYLPAFAQDFIRLMQEV